VCVLYLSTWQVQILIETKVSCNHEMQIKIKMRTYLWFAVGVVVHTEVLPSLLDDLVFVFDPDVSAIEEGDNLIDEETTLDLRWDPALVYRCIEQEFCSNRKFRALGGGESEAGELGGGGTGLSTFA
jgi:hypothetical protein